VRGAVLWGGAFIGATRAAGRGGAVGALFPPWGSPFPRHSGLAYVFGTLVLAGAVYLLGVLARSGLQGPVRRLTDRTLRRIPLVGGVYNVADRFVGLLDHHQGGADIGAVSPRWGFFGGGGGGAGPGLGPRAAAP